MEVKSSTTAILLSHLNKVFTLSAICGNTPVPLTELLLNPSPPSWALIEFNSIVPPVFSFQL